MDKTSYWWEKEGLRFECTQCGKCCGGEPGSIWVDEKERSRIAEFLAIDEVSLRKDYLVRKGGFVSIKERENFDCAFLDPVSKKCTIYPVRPDQCSAFPFWDALLTDKKIWNFYAIRCPGMNNGKLYNKEIIQDLLNNEKNKIK